MDLFYTLSGFKALIRVWLDVPHVLHSEDGPVTNADRKKFLLSGTLM